MAGLSILSVCPRVARVGCRPPSVVPFSKTGEVGCLLVPSGLLRGIPLGGTVRRHRNSSVRRCRSGGGVVATMKSCIWDIWWKIRAFVSPPGFGTPGVRSGVGPGWSVVTPRATEAVSP